MVVNYLFGFLFMKLYLIVCCDKSIWNMIVLFMVFDVVILFGGKYSENGSVCMRKVISLMEVINFLSI